MNIDEMIKKLEELKQQHGNVDVKLFNFENETDLKIDIIGVPKNTKDKFIRIIPEEY